LACPDCSEIPPVFDRVVAAFDYAWPGELLIHQLKLQYRFSGAPVLARLLAARCAESAEAAQVASHQWPYEAGGWGPGTRVVAVPASRQSLRMRGFNPAAEIGRHLARRLGLAWRPELLERTHEGQVQKSQTREARRLAVRGLYRCQDGVQGQEILVVDDVMTTGSTLNAIATLMKEKGALRVGGAVVARTPRRLPVREINTSVS